MRKISVHFILPQYPYYWVDQAVNIEGQGFESPHRWSTSSSPLSTQRDSPQLAGTVLLKSRAHCYLINKRIIKRNKSTKWVSPLACILRNLKFRIKYVHNQSFMRTRACNVTRSLIDEGNGLSKPSCNCPDQEGKFNANKSIHTVQWCKTFVTC